MATSKKIRDAIALLRLEGYEPVSKNQIRCTCCGKYRSVDQNNWYQSYSPIHKGNTAVKKVLDKKTGVSSREEKTFAPFCSNCIEKYLKDGDLEDLMFVLRWLDRPYIKEVWENTWDKHAHKSKPITVFGYYMKNIALNHKSKFFDDSDDTYDVHADNSNSDEDIEYLGKRQKKEAIKRWGTSWSDYELMKLEEFYHDMKAKNRIDTPQDEDYLKKLAKLSVKIDKAIDDDESSKVKQLGDLYSKYMTDSKFRAMDMTDADKQGGIRTFSQIYAEVETPDFIPPWHKYAKFLKIKQDIVDKTIMHIENFTLRFKSAERMAKPPSDCPQVEEGDLDVEASE